MTQGRQGFTVERDFGFAYGEDSAVIRVDIKGARGLAMGRLAGELRRAGNGGIRTAVVTLAGKDQTVIPVDRLRAAVELEVDLRDQLRLERLVRARA